MRLLFSFVWVYLAACLTHPLPANHTRYIKGLQVQDLQDAIQLGIRHATLNVNLSDLDFLGALSNDDAPLTPDQESKLRALKSSIQTLNAANVKTYLILLVYPKPQEQEQPKILDPRYDPTLNFTVGAFNSATPEGLTHVNQVIHQLTYRLNLNQRIEIEGFIVGNEVNSSKMWNNHGPLPFGEAVKSYERVVRTIFHATREHFPQSKVYLSFDHFWGVDMHSGRLPEEFYPSRDYVLKFAEIAKQHGDYPWHLAFHPYPENLGNPKTWLDKSALHHDKTPRITFKNLDVLCQFMKQEPLLYQGKPRRIILSEQGLHSVNTPEGLELQAIAFVYVWNQVKVQPMIDALIWHRHVDHAHEGGLNLGLWTRKPDSIATPESKKPIYELFREAESPHWPEVSAPYQKKLIELMKEAK